MRRSLLIALLAAGVLLAGGGAASGKSTAGIVGIAGGSYGFAGTAAGSTFDVRPFSFG